MRRVGLSIALVLTAAVASAERPQHDGKTLLFGNLHAHSSLSDDVTGGAALAPARAFAYAAQHGIDFLAISDHQQGADLPANRRYSMTPDEYRTQVLDVAQRYNREHPGGLIAIPAFEWGTISAGNHVNVLGARSLPPDTLKNADYAQLYEWAQVNADFVQLNHPNSWGGVRNRDTSVGNFGEALYPIPADFVAQANATVRAMAIICTVAGGHVSGRNKHSEAKTHRAMQWEKLYRQYLNMGFHLSPAADQDTHWRNWGTVTAARTAVWADGQTYDDLVKAVLANRVYASEDDEMAVAFRVRYKDRTYWMGETVPLEQDEDDVVLLVKIWQGAGSDGDSRDEGPYAVQLVVDDDGVDGSEPAPVGDAVDVADDQEREIPLRVSDGQYVYLHVTEQNGKDNPVGDGEDDLHQETGATGADGKRDDLNDSAVTAPLWFRRAEPAAEAATFVWSKKSNVYHDRTCFAVEHIGAANRVEGAAPSGKSKHNCRPSSEHH